MTDDRPGEDALEPVWAERFGLDVAEDTRCERLLLVKAVVIALVVGAAALARWLLV